MVVVSFFFAERLIDLLVIPIGGLDKLQAIEVSENIGTYMKVALLSGFILDFPIIIYELLRFILPGLNKREQRYILTSIPVITVFFLAGVCLCILDHAEACPAIHDGFSGSKDHPPPFQLH